MKQKIVLMEQSKQRWWEVIKVLLESTCSLIIYLKTFGACKPKSAKAPPRRHHHCIHQSFHRLLQPLNLLCSLRTPFILKRCHSNFLATMEQTIGQPNRGEQFFVYHKMPPYQQGHNLLSFGRRDFPMVSVDHVYHSPHGVAQHSS